MNNKFQEALKRMFLDEYRKNIYIALNRETFENAHERTDKIKKVSEQQISDFELIKELVDKATPKKPNMENQHYICCPNCTSDEIEFYDYDHNEVKLKHCNRCGQAIDWSDDE